MDQPLAPQAASSSSSPQRPAPLTVTKAFSLTQEEVDILKLVAQEEGLLAESGVVRLLIREGYKFRQLRREAEKVLIAQSLQNGHTSK